ncbi:MAG: hypothetical protein WD825_17720, partial [Gemmatimonadaceae bacterium]
EPICFLRHSRTIALWWSRANRCQMKKLIPWIAMLVASSAGWWLGAKAGIMTAFMVSTVAGGFGLYFGARWVRENF